MRVALAKATAGPEPIDRLLPDLCCPLALIREGAVVALRRDGDALVSDRGYRYPIHDGVPDLRPAPNADSNGAVDHYSVIHRLQSDASAPWTEEALQTLSSAYGLKTNDVSGRRVLVVGAALGTELGLFCRLGAALVVGLDYAGFVRTLRRRIEPGATDLHLVQGDALTLPFGPKSFDLTFSSGVLQHTRSPELGFREIYRVTRPGGLINLSTAYPDNITQRNITRARLKHQFHRMAPSEAVKRLRRRLKQRIIFERLGLARLDYRLSGGMAFPGQNLPFGERLGAALDTYFPPFRHTLDPKDIRGWFTELGMDPSLPRNLSIYFNGASDNAYGAAKSFIARRPSGSASVRAE